MEELVRIDISTFEALGTSMCVTQKQGLKLSKYIKKGLDSGAHVVVSMRGVVFISLTFLEAAFGTQAQDYGRGRLRTHLHVTEEGACLDRENLRRVFDSAYKYYELQKERAVVSGGESANGRSSV